MEKDVYDAQSKCESLHDQELCNANNEVIDKITKRNNSFCSFCLSGVKKDFCVTLLKVWKTLHSIRFVFICILMQLRYSYMKKAKNSHWLYYFKQIFIKY